MMTVSVTGLDDLVRKLDAVPKAAKSAGDTKAAEVAPRVVAEIRARTPVERGELRDSVRTEKAPDGGTYVKAGGTPATARPTAGGTVYDEAVLQEFGTIHANASPFFLPGVDAASQSVTSDVGNAAGDAAEKAFE